MKKVLVNVPFRDKYTKELYEAGKTYPMPEERVKEVKEVNPNFVTVIGEVPAPVEETPDVPEVPDAEAPEEEPVEELPEEPVEEEPVEKPKKKGKK